MYEYIYIYICMHVQIRTYRQTDIQTYRNTCLHICYIHTYIHTYIHPYMHTYIHTYILTYLQTYIHVHMYVRIYIHRERERCVLVQEYATCFILAYIRTRAYIEGWKPVCLPCTCMLLKLCAWAMYVCTCCLQQLSVAVHASISGSLVLTP